MLQLLTRIENMLALCERRINIGINENAGPNQRHGVLWVDADTKEGKKNLRVPVIIDHPERISSGLNYATWRRVKRQIQKLGINASHIELKFKDGAHFCYKLDEFKELYARGKGRPVYYAAEPA